MKTKYAITMLSVLRSRAAMLLAMLLMVTTVAFSQSKAGIGIKNNTITSPATLIGCDQLTIDSIVGSKQQLYTAGASVPSVNLYIDPWANNTCSEQIVTFAWQKSTDYDPENPNAATWTFLGNGITDDVTTWKSNHKSYIPENAEATISQTTWYRRGAYVNCTNLEPDGVAKVFSDPIELKIVESDIDCATNKIQLSQGNVASCNSSKVSLTGSKVTACLDNETKYQWQKSNGTDDAFADIAGATTKDLLNYTANATTWFRRLAIGSEQTPTVCESDTVKIFVYPNPAKPIIEGVTNVCLTGEVANASYKVSEAEQGTTYYWEVDETAGDDGAWAVFTGGSFGDQTNVVWHGVSLPGKTSWIRVTAEQVHNGVTCRTTSDKYLVTVNKTSNATILTPDSLKLCAGEGGYHFGGTLYDNTTKKLKKEWYRINLDAVWTADYQKGYWTVGAPQCAIDSGVKFIVANREVGHNVATGEFPFGLTKNETILNPMLFVYADSTALGSLGGHYSITWTEESKGICANSSKTIHVFLHENPVLNKSAIVNNVCGNKHDIEAGIGLPVYKCVESMEVKGTWTATLNGEGTTKVTFGDKNAMKTTAEVGENGYGTYKLTWTVTNGECPVSQSIMVTFSESFAVDAGEKQRVCGQWVNTVTKQGMYADLEATIEGVATYSKLKGEWTCVEKPSGSNWPTFDYVDSLATRVKVSSMGTYTFQFKAVHKGNSLCADSSRVLVTFYPGILSATFEPVPAAKACTLAMATKFTAEYDFGKMSGRDTPDYYTETSFEIEKFGGINEDGEEIWDSYNNFTLNTDNGETIIGPLLQRVVKKEDQNIAYCVPSNYIYDQAMPTIPVGLKTNHNKVNHKIAFNFNDYGKYRIKYAAYLTPRVKRDYQPYQPGVKGGSQPAPALGNNNPLSRTDWHLYNDTSLTSEPCLQEVTQEIELYWKPVAEILNNSEDTMRICGLNSDITVELKGNTPRGVYYKGAWHSDYPYGSVANEEGIIDGWNKVVVGWEVEDANGNDALENGDVELKESNNGRDAKVSANKQGVYTVKYVMNNVPGGCSNYDPQVIAFYEIPNAGIDDTVRHCGIITETIADAKVCTGWDRKVYFEASVKATKDNVESVNIDGIWEVDSYPDALVDIYRNDTLAINSVMQLTWDTLAPRTATFKTPVAGHYVLKFVAYNTSGYCNNDESLHHIDFNETPLPRDIHKINVDGDGTDASPYKLAKTMLDDTYTQCLSCPNKDAWYIIERPDLYHNYTVTVTDEDGEEVVINPVGIDENADLYENYDYETSIKYKSTTAPNHKVTFFGTNLEEGTVDGPVNLPINGGKIVKTYALANDGKTLISNPQAAGHRHIVQVRWEKSAEGILKFREENTITRCYTDNEFVINKVDSIYIEGKTKVYVQEATTYKVKPNELPGTNDYQWTVVGGEITAGQGSSEITVKWGNGPTGKVSLAIDGYCFEIASLDVTMSGAKLIGQVKYFNKYETPMPSPYVSCQPCGGNETGAFHVALLDSDLEVIATQEVRNENNMSSYFEFAVVPGKTYGLAVYEETTNNKLKETYTFNRWGGVSAGDALIVNYMAAESADKLYTNFPWILPSEDAEAYTKLFSAVANVNGDNNITAGDALTMMKRITNPSIMPTFPNNVWNFMVGAARVETLSTLCYPKAPEYVLEPTVDGYNYVAASPANEFKYKGLVGEITAGDNVINIYYVATGDVNASYVPQFNPRSASLKSADINGQTIGINGKGKVKVSLSSNETIEAYNLELRYDASKVRVLNVEGAEFVGNEGKGVLHLGSLKGANDITLNVEMLSGEVTFEVASTTEFVNSAAQPIEVEVEIPTLKSLASAMADMSVTAYPNPFNDKATIKYELPVDGKVTIEVYNKLGQKVTTLVNNYQTTGTQSVELNQSELSGAGSYIYKVVLEGSNSTYTKQGTLILVK